MKVDLLFLSHHRDEFTEQSVAALIANTDPGLVARLVHLENRPGPVEAMQEYLSSSGADVFAKIDNDVIVPPGWLEACVHTLEKHPEVDLLGIEPWQSRTPAPWNPAAAVPAPERNAPAGALCVAAPYIGGIGLMRRRAFERGLMKPHSIYGGFTDYQIAHPEIRKAWIVPPLKLFLLDRLPMEPWRSLSQKYIRNGWQRPWTNYTAAQRELWDWWFPVQPARILEWSQLQR